MRILFLFASILLTAPLMAQEVQIMKFAEFEETYLKASEGDDTLYVISFWATWCKPCVAELPAFEVVNAKFKGQPVRVILVSLDFVDKVETQLKPFLYYRKMQSQVVLMDAPHENEWIPKVSEEWSGAIPATLMWKPKTGVKQFYEQMFDVEELTQEITKNL